MGNKSSKSICLKESENCFSIYPPIVNDIKFGKSSVNFGYLDVNISDSGGSTFNIGQIVKFELFKDHSEFKTKVAITSSKPKGNYSEFLNPKSEWFNVLLILGKVEVEWKDRPFGFTENLEVNKEDIYLYSKAVWNYFVNYIYGIPISECVKYNDIEDEHIQMISRKITIGNYDYIELDVVNLGTICGYSSWVSGGKGNYVVNDVILTPLWRRIFGKAKPRKSVMGMFEKCYMRLRIYLRFESVGNTFLSYINIASVNMGTSSRINEEFMEVQINALKSAIISIDSS